MRKPRAVLLVLSLVLSTSVQGSEATPLDAVRNLFAAISAFDYGRMRSTVTTDFQLLEDGEVWDIETLIAAIRPGEGSYIRRNYFSPIRTEGNNEVVWISYWNRATFLVQNEVNERVWLESVVLIRNQGEWKVQLMHSTPLPGNRVPTSIEFKEHIE